MSKKLKATLKCLIQSFKTQIWGWLDLFAWLLCKFIWFNFFWAKIKLLLPFRFVLLFICLSVETFFPGRLSRVMNRNWFRGLKTITPGKFQYKPPEFLSSDKWWVKKFCKKFRFLSKQHLPWPKTTIQLNSSQKIIAKINQ